MVERKKDRPMIRGGLISFEIWEHLLSISQEKIRCLAAQLKS